ncbi:MAG: HNH endonuclease signature motif containing protein, partial [Candidatus Nanopelagicales bacterium]
PDPLRAFITARDGTCRFPGCRRRADRCQVDHATPWDHDGTTSRDNLGALCTRHHQLKTHAGWQITHTAADGTCTWTSPMGRTYHHHPPDIRGSG